MFKNNYFFIANDDNNSLNIGTKKPDNYRAFPQKLTS